MRANLWVLVVILAASSAHGLCAQAPNTVGRLAAGPQLVRTQDTTAGISGIPSNSPYFSVGAQAFYKLDGTGDFTDDFLVSGQMVVDQLKLGPSERFHVPFIANFSSLATSSNEGVEGEVSKLLTSSQGLSFSLQPYYETTAAGSGKLRATVYASAGWKMSSGRDLADTSITRKLHQGRISAGVAVDVPLLAATTPFTLSIEPVYRFISRERYKQLFGEDRQSFTSLELTGIVPVNHLGLLAQGIFTDGAPSVWRVGFILAGNASGSS